MAGDEVTHRELILELVEVLKLFVPEHIVCEADYHESDLCRARAVLEKAKLMYPSFPLTEQGIEDYLKYVDEHEDCVPLDDVKEAAQQ